MDRTIKSRDLNGMGISPAFAFSCGKRGLVEERRPGEDWAIEEIQLVIACKVLMQRGYLFSTVKRMLLKGSGHLQKISFKELRAINDRRVAELEADIWGATDEN